MLDGLLRQRIQTRHLRVLFPDGSVREYGGGGGPRLEWRLQGRWTERRILGDPEYEFAATYVDGLWDTSDLTGLIELVFRDLDAKPRKMLGLLGRTIRAIRQLNRAVRARQQISYHYDLDEGLFRCFLDRELHYSCAYFRQPGLDLEAAQRAKCAHLARKLALKPGQEVLDIGCGWGSLALYLAAECNVRVTGITLSKEQWRVANERARARGLARDARFLYEDYREHRGQYDRIVSVGMFEHVGVPNYPAFFDQMRALLRSSGGVAVLHHIGRPGPPGLTNRWIRRHIFPGGYNPSLSEVMAPVERSGLWTTDVEIWRLHYRITLSEWGRRFRTARAEVVKRKGERFARLWEFYLAACEAAFATGQLVVFQLQLANRLEVLPLTRDYLYQTKPGIMESHAARGGH